MRALEQYQDKHRGYFLSMLTLHEDSYLPAVLGVCARTSMGENEGCECMTFWGVNNIHVDGVK